MLLYLDRKDIDLLLQLTNYHRNLTINPKHISIYNRIIKDLTEGLKDYE